MAGSSTVETDVVVIGGGGSGLAAAIEARTVGRDVVLVEKNPKLGGSTARSIGSISASLSPYQIAKGIKDTPEDHFEDLGKFNEISSFEDDVVLRRLLTDNVPDTLRWLMSMGVRFFGPMPEPPHRRPRMHNVLPNSSAYIYHLARHARRIGVDIRTSMDARQLVVRDGAVRGVECLRENGTSVTFLAKGAVVLASGDYSANEAMKRQFSHPDLARIGPTNPTNTGDGHLMAEKIGGRVLNGANIYPVIKTIPPRRKKFVQMLPPHPWMIGIINWSMENLPDRILRPFVMSFLTTVLSISPKLYEAGAILVNLEGKRFGDELDNHVIAVGKQPEQMACLIFDSVIAEKFSAWPNYISTAPGVAYAYLQDYRRSRPDIMKKAGSIEELAAKLNLPAPALVATMQAYNGGRDPIGQASRGRRAQQTLGKPPYYGLGPVRSVVNITDGGLAVDAQLRVLGAHGAPLPGLYACGAVGQGGMVLEGHGHHIGWAFTSGRIAGRNAAFNVSTPPV